MAQSPSATSPSMLSFLHHIHSSSPVFLSFSSHRGNTPGARMLLSFDVDRRGALPFACPYIPNRCCGYLDGPMRSRALPRGGGDAALSRSGALSNKPSLLRPQDEKTLQLSLFPLLHLHLFFCPSSYLPDLICTPLPPYPLIPFLWEKKRCRRGS